MGDLALGLDLLTNKNLTRAERATIRALERKFKAASRRMDKFEARANIIKKKTAKRFQKQKAIMKKYDAEYKIRGHSKTAAALERLHDKESHAIEAIQKSADKVRAKASKAASEANRLYEKQLAISHRAHERGKKRN